MPIEKCVENFLKETEFKGFGRFFDILDLSIHWTDLNVLMNRIFGQKQKPIAYEAPNKIAEPPASISDQSGFIIELSKEQISNLAPVRKTRSRPLLLLVEDDPFTLQLVRLAFKENYDVITAETARQALVYYQRHLPDMVFLDIQLPDGNGINLLQQMTKADEDCYAIMLSSHSQKERILECHELGSKGFIAKPFTRQRLLDAAEKFIATRKIPFIGNRHGT
jgi:CheY-like chemotaxis protein